MNIGAVSTNFVLTLEATVWQHPSDPFRMAQRCAWPWGSHPADVPDVPPTEGTAEHHAEA
jgi:hypothetical protein